MIFIYAWLVFVLIVLCRYISMYIYERFLWNKGRCRRCGGIWIPIKLTRPWFTCKWFTCKWFTCKWFTCKWFTCKCRFVSCVGVFMGKDKGTVAKNGRRRA